MTSFCKSQVVEVSQSKRTHCSASFFSARSTERAKRKLQRRASASNFQTNADVLTVIRHFSSSNHLAKSMSDAALLKIMTSQLPSQNILPPLSKGGKRGPRGGVYDPFPIKLHRMLDEVRAAGLESVVSWLEHGRAFRIHQPKVFAATIMCRFFNQSKYTSFQRQLNLYGEYLHVQFYVLICQNTLSHANTMHCTCRILSMRSRT